MLAKRFRLPVNAFPAKAKTLHQGAYFVVKFSPNLFSYNRVGIIVPSKTAPRAVERNRLRRKIFDLFRMKSPATKVMAGKDLLVIIKPLRLDATKERILLKELTAIIDKL